METPQYISHLKVDENNHPCSTPKTALKTLYRWIKGCPRLMSELESMNYNPNRRMFLRSEVEAIVKHLGEP